MSALEAFERYGPLTRRRLLRAGGLGLTGTGAAMLFGCGSDDGPRTVPSLDAPLETTKLRLVKSRSICTAPYYLADQFLSDEGFTDVSRLDLRAAPSVLPALANGDLDMVQWFGAPAAISIDAGQPVVAVAGIHAGCFELFASQGISSVRDLKGMRIAVSDVSPSAVDFVFLTTILAFIGIDARREVTFVKAEGPGQGALLQSGQVDAVLAVPPRGIDFRAKNIGHVILNSMQDHPWSEYFCCMLVANKNFVTQNPAATLHAIRAVLKGADFCSAEPERAARFLVDQDDFPTNDANNYEYGVQTMRMIPYAGWRKLDAEDALRFFSLRLREGGLVKGSPDSIIRKGTDWRFITAIKRQMPPTAFAPRLGSDFALNCEVDPVGPPIAAAAPRSAWGS